MRKLMLIIAIATMTVVANAQNKVTTAKTTTEMVYYYTDFNIVRMKDTARKKDVYVPYIGNDTDGEMAILCALIYLSGALIILQVLDGNYAGMTITIMLFKGG